MFGIGGGEMIVILIVLLIAVGPDRMPTVMKAVGRGVREFRRTTREIRSTVGIDELLRDDDIRDPLGLKKQQPVKPKSSPAAAGSKAPVSPTDKSLSPEQLAKEQPAEGVDVAHMRSSIASDAAEPEPR